MRFGHKYEAIETRNVVSFDNDAGPCIQPTFTQICKGDWSGLLKTEVCETGFGRTIQRFSVMIFNREAFSLQKKLITMFVYQLLSIS